jgi:uncharacterized protein (DUF2252 family)
MADLRIKPSDRQEHLTKRRRLKMAESAHAYVRGNTAKFYEWLESSSAAKVMPDGPPVWICGDCHVGNLGPVANTKGEVEIQIRDLDQTVIGNPAHDLIRLGLSLAMAARSSDLPGVTTARMIEQMIEGYGRALSRRPSHPRGKQAEPVRLVMQQALKRKWRHMAEERIEDVKPTIPLGKRFWALSQEEKVEIARVFRTEEARSLVTCLKGRKDGDSIEVMDAAYWIKGCSSLGRLRYVVLVRAGKNGKNGLCLVDIKEAAQAASPRWSKAEMPRGNAERIVAGARCLSPFLGERMLATSFLDRQVVMRELMPQDLKFEMEELTEEEAIAVAGLLAHVVGTAHARQMKPEARKRWLAELKRSRSKKLDAPNWLWTSVVELVASHEAAYLDHCRLYALEG